MILEELFYEDDILENIEEEIGDESNSPELAKELSEAKKESYEPLSRSNTKKNTFHNRKRSPTQNSKSELPIISEQDIFPTDQNKKFDFVKNCILTEEENKNMTIIPIRKRQSAKIFQLSFENFLIFSKSNIRNEGEKPRGMIFAEKSSEVISRSDYNQKFSHPLFRLKTKNLTPSIEDLNVLIEKAPNLNSPKRLEEKTPKDKFREEKSTMEHKKSFENGNYHNLIGELEFDKMKIYKIYFIHNNIDQIIAKANAFLQKRRVFNPRKNRKILIKKNVEKKIYPLRSES